MTSLFSLFLCIFHSLTLIRYLLLTRTDKLMTPSQIDYIPLDAVAGPYLL